MDRLLLKRVARVFTSIFLAQTLIAPMHAYAQGAVPLTAAPKAPSGQKPLIDAAANGTPIVLIAPPSKSGVSRNQFDQFNVGTNGLILNNSTGNVQTQIGGWVTGNLQLGLTPARIILNEVTGPDASQLKGTIEVAGQKADIVIANPNGITCDGCGFLNADRATLSTGTTQFGNEGAITGFDVRQGVLNVGPAGLNATQQQQLDLLARGLVIEGELFAQNAQAIIGANQVVYGTLRAVPQYTSQSGTGAAPKFAIDIKDVGGMYAGQIYLIATDKGLGVNSLGRTATLSGNLVLSANGDLTLKDTYSSADAQITSAGKVTLTGQTLAQGAIDLEAPGQLVNSGALQAGTLQLKTRSVDNGGTIAQTEEGANLTLTLPGGLQNSGQIYTPGNLHINSRNVTSEPGGADGQLIAGKSLSFGQTTQQIAGQQLSADSDIKIDSKNLSTTGGGMTAGGKVTLDAKGNLSISGTTIAANDKANLSAAEIAIDGAHIEALNGVSIAATGALTANTTQIDTNSALSLAAAHIDVQSSTLSAATTAQIQATGGLRLDGSQVTAGQTVDVQGQGLSTAGATIAAAKIAVDAGAGALDNTGGKLLASSSDPDALTVSATGIDNTSGQIRANGGLSIDARGGSLDNSGGTVAGTTGTLANLGGLTNNGGTLYTQSDLNIAGTALDNNHGTIVTAGNLSVATPGKTIDNNAGLMQAGGSVSLNSGNANIDNADGSVIAGEGLTVKGATVDSTSGTLASGADMNITATNVLASGATLGSGGAMNIAAASSADLSSANVGANGDINITGGSVQAEGAKVFSQGNLSVAGSSITGGNWSAQGNVRAISAGTLDLSGGALLAGGNVLAQGQGIVTDYAHVSGQAVVLDAGSGTLSNVGGQIVAAGASGLALDVTANGIDNTGGTLSSNADASLNAGGQTIDNTNGNILAAGNLLMQAGNLINHGGTVSTASSLTFQGIALDNNGGTIQTQGKLTIDTAGKQLDNTAGKLIAGDNLQIKAGTLLNAGGTIASGASTSVQADSLDTSNGHLSGTQQLDVFVTKHLAAGAATLATQGKLTATAADIDAQGATLQAGQTVDVSATGAIDISHAVVVAQGPNAGDIHVGGSSIAASGATIVGDAGVTLNSATGIDATAAKLSAIGNATLTAANGAATLDGAAVLAGGTANIAATGITAANASIGAVGSVTLNAGTGDFNAPNVLVRSQSGNIDLNAGNVKASGTSVAGTTPSTGLLASGAITINAGGAVDLSNAATSAGTDVAIAAQGDVTNSAGAIVAGGRIGIAGTSLNNQGGIVDANGPIDLNVSNGQVINDQGRISTRDVLTMSAAGAPLANLSNAGGVIETNGALTAHLQSFNNEGGRVTALAGLAIDGGPVNNAAGLLASQGNVSVDTHGGDFAGDNSQVLSTQGDVAIAAGAITLGNGSVLAQGNVTLNSTAITANGATMQANTGSVQIGASAGAANLAAAGIAAANSATVTATQGIDVSGGSVSAQTVAMNAGSRALNNTSGRIVAVDTANIASTGLNNVAGTIASNGALTINAVQANANSATDSTGGTIESGADITLIAGDTKLNNATVASGGKLTLVTGALQASQAVVQAQGDINATSTGAVNADHVALAAGGNLTLTAQQGIDVSTGSVSAQVVSLNAGSGALNNAAGNIVANGAADIRSTGLNNQGGVIAANGNLAINAAQANTNTATDSTGGLLQSGGDLTLTAGATTLTNATVTAGGKLAANATGTVTADHAAITAGGNTTVIATQGLDLNHSSVSGQAVTLNAGSGALNNTAGSVIALTTADVRSTGLSNIDGTIASNGALTINAAQAGAAVGTDNTRGTIRSAQASVTLTTGDLVNSRANATDAGSVINAAGDLSINATGAVDNSRSEISAANNLQIAATGALANDEAQLVAGQGVTISAGGLSNTSGLVAGNGNMSITAAAGGVTNTGGAIQSGGDLAIASAGAVTADNSQIVANGALSLSSGAFSANNTTLNSGSDMTLRAGATQLAAATVATGGSLDARTSSLAAQGVNVQAAGNLSFNAGSGAFSAIGSQWTAGQSLALSGGAVDVSHSTLAANTAVSVTGKSVDATQSNISSTGNVTVKATAGALDIGGATLMAGQDLTATGTGGGTTVGAKLLAGRDLSFSTGSYFDFAAPDVQYQFSRDLSISAQGINTAGQQVSARNLTLDARGGQLDNQGGTLQATGNLSVIGSGLNNDGGVIAANGQVTASAKSGTLDNASGQIYSVQGSATVAGGTIQNASGTISAANDVTITGGSLDNTGNTIVAGGNLTAHLTGALNNTGGKLVANSGDTNVTASSINNQTGIVSGANVTVGGALNNSIGVVSGTSSVKMTGAINNDAGVIEAGTGGISIDTQGGTLTNTNSGTTRGIVSLGGVDISAGALNNQAGYIGANGALNVKQSTSIDNRGGTLLSLGNGSVTTSGTLNNEGGSILSGADLTVAAGTLDNSNAGTVYATGNLSVTATTIDNSNTKNTAYTTGLLAGGNATINAGTVNNTNGAIVAMGDATVHATTSLNNTQGQISGSNVTINTPQMTNTGGRVDAQKSLSLTAPQYSADGTLASNGDLQMNLQGNQTNTGTLSANGSLTVTTTGQIVNEGHISAQDNLTLNSTGIDNQAGAIIDSQSTTLNVGGGTVNNAGLINSTSGATTITAGTVNNTGRIYGDSVTLNGTTNNSTGVGGAAVIASRAGDVTFNGNLNNTSGAQVFSMGNLTINGAAKNDGSTLDAMGNLTITGVLTNTNSNLTTGTQTTTQAVNELYITPTYDTTQYLASTLGWNDDSGGHWVLPSVKYPFSTFGSNIIPAATAQYCTGTEGGLDCGPFVYVYSMDDPIWAKFKVTPPTDLTPPTMPAAGQVSGCMVGSGIGQDQVFVHDMTGDCGTYWTALDTYNAAVADRYAQLDNAIGTFNSDLQSRELIDWYETTVTSKTVTQTVATSSQPGQVLAGGDITTGAGSTNQDSKIIAGGNVTFNMNGNIATQGTSSTTETGTMVFNHRTWSGGLCGCYGRDVGAPQPIAYPPTINSVNLAIGEVTPHGTPLAPSPADTSTLAGAAQAVVAVVTPPSGKFQNTTVTGTTATTQNGNPTATGGGTVTVSTTTTTDPQGTGTVTVDGGSTVTTTGTTPTTVTTTTPTTGAPGVTAPGTASITASLSGAADAALPGSVIAANARTGQLTAITTSLTNFTTAVKSQPIPTTTVDTKTAKAVLPMPVLAAGYKTVHATGNVLAPASQLFTLNTSPTGPYIETDPAFTGYRTWVSSSYMLRQFQIDPERNLKLYGDGFAEQRLVDDEIMALTGQRFISGYSDTESEYQALLNAGVMYGHKYQLTPGVALTADQMATLTTDIVWLEARTVTLPDGSTVQALVPTVYLRRPTSGDLTPTGALVAGSSVTLRANGDSGDVTNTGTVYAYGDASTGGGVLDVQGTNVTNSGTFSGHTIDITATHTINDVGGVITGLGAGSSATLNARDIILQTTTQSGSASVVGPNGTSTGTSTNIDHVATITADSVTLAAKNNIDLRAATIVATGDLSIKAKTITTEAVQTAYTLNVPLGGAGGTTQGKTGYYNLDSTTQQTTNLIGNNVDITAKGDATFSGTNVTAVNDITVKAATVTIDAAKNSLSIDQQGVSGSGYERAASSDETLAGGVFAAGNNLSITATKGSVTGTGAQLTATNGATDIEAKHGDVSLLDATTEHSTTYELYKSSHSGVGSGILGGDGMTGAHSESSLSTSSSQSTIAEGTTVSGGTVTIRAGGDINAVGANIVSDTQTTLKAGGDVTLKAATDTQTSTSFAEDKASGFGALGGGGPSYGTRDQSTTTTTTATHAVGTNVGSLYGNVTISAGGTYTQDGSNVVAPEGDVTITGKKVVIIPATETSTSDTEQTFKQSGVSASVSNPIINALQSAGEISRASSRTDDPRAQALAAATVGLTAYNTYSSLTTNPASATSVGINISLGSTKSQSDTHEETTTSASSKVIAGGNVSITATGAGEDSTITVQGSDITAGNNATLKADGKVNLVAAENTDTQHSTNSSNSASVGIGINFGAQNGISFNASASHGSGNSDSTDVTWTNTHVTAGNTFNIQSGGDTTLNGAVIAANTVTGKIGGDLNLGSLRDTSTYTSHQSSSGGGVSVCVPPLCFGASSASVNVSNANVTGNYASVTEQTGIKAGDGGFQLDVTGNTDLKGAVLTSTQAAIDAGKNSLTTRTLTTSDIQNTDSYHASGYSVGASLTGMLGDQSTATTDAQKAAVKAGNDAKPVGGSAGYSSESGSQSSVTQSGISVGAITLTNGDSNSLNLLNQTVTTGTDTTNAINKAWNGSQLMSNVQASTQITAALGQSATEAWAAYSNKKLSEATTPDEVACWSPDGPCRATGHAIIGGLTAGPGGALGAGVSTLITPQIGDAIKSAGFTGSIADTLITAVAAGIGTVVGGTAGAAGAYNEVRNNYLTSDQWNALAATLKACKDSACVTATNATFAQLSGQQDQALAAACTDLNSTACRTLVSQAVAGSATQLSLVTSGSLGENYLAGGDYNSLVNTYSRKVQAQDVVNACNSNLAQCNANTLAASAKVLLTASAIATVAVAAPALAVDAAALLSEGAIDFCTARPQTCLSLVNAAAEATAGVPVSGVSVPVAGSIRNVNPTGGTLNCVNCVIATDATLRGNPTSALPGGPYTLPVLENYYGSRFAPASLSSIESQLLTQGNGATGIVYGYPPSGENVGHVFNVVNQNGVIRFLDGQTGGVADPTLFPRFQFMPLTSIGH